MSAPENIISLVKRFESNRDAYKAGKYNETQVRREFIAPFFEELGWDVANKHGYAEAYKDVVHEDAIKVGRATKAPDYSFRIGGVRKFFLEAKKPSVNIKEDTHPAFQLRRYAWSAKLPLSILTDFEELAVYDCRVKPVKTDKASHSRILYYNYNEYISRWDEIASIFSRDNILKGSFDKFVESKKDKRGTAEVDAEFLKEIERWRNLLARNIALRNLQLSQLELNLAVQLTIDRIIFLRICEDRGVEPYGNLMALQNGSNVYNRIFQLFRKADDRYNSGLFHFRPEIGHKDDYDSLTPELAIDDKVLKDILKNLYYPDSPYEFSVLGADILGQVYEQFLGKVIRLTPSHQAKIEEKPEVRKAGGVFYTPSYIVDYIVKQTVGKLVEGKRPGPRGAASKLRILDPACGSGSFLLGAYQLLLDWHLEEYVSDGPEKWSKGKIPRLYQVSGGEWRLTTDEKKRVLTNNIFGVDIDPQAVEVTKLSLLLKVLEDEDEQTLYKQLSLFQERVLPNLDRNIKCGNSLIGLDYLETQPLLDNDKVRRVNPFDWQAEFPEVMAAGGFDAVIGNPPWGAEFTDQELKYHRHRNKEIIVRMIDSFMYFVYQSCNKLRAHGLFGMILPDVILYQRDNMKLRKYILENFAIRLLLNLGGVFEKVTRPACILIFERSEARAKHIIRVTDVLALDKTEKPAAILDDAWFESLLQGNMLKIPGMLFVTKRPARYDIWAKVKSIPHMLLADVVDKDGIQRGVSPDLKKAFLVDSQSVWQHNLESTKLRKVLTGGKQVKRYFIDYPDLWVIYTTRKDNFRQLPNICAYIDQFKSKITCKEVKQNKHPLYSLHRPRKEHIFLKTKKLLGVITGDKIVVALDEAQTFATDGLYLFGVGEWVNLYYLMGILNSKLFVFVYRLLALEKGRVLAQVKPTILSQLPIRTINFDDPTDVSRHDKMVILVKRMLELNRNLDAAAVPADKILYQRQIEAIDRQIDALVYDLYRLTENEINIVESDTGQ